MRTRLNNSEPRAPAGRQGPAPLLLVRRRTNQKYLEIVQELRGCREPMSSMAERMGLMQWTLARACGVLGVRYRLLARDGPGVARAIRRLRKRMRSIPSMSPRAARIVKLYNRGKGPTMKQIAQRYRITTQRVQQIISATGIRRGSGRRPIRRA